ncbi:uroporphyrinogen-III C-methyltransferase [Methylorubrum extorquens]|uniref:uroporphyrinogen-III C-methyltransferase n=1 Tax=Methylorubrum extorquens (strain CM4 / NCIMB 13688) TaxID=440085 RepID=B7L3N7_METC4|nr:uroporphyrinogen-III C-methyltransferase [Methylorubrum extorquens]ACK86445.1 uroporphyrin-III C-methyltransferase [Methylorubrum extorquens CM4]
MIDLGPLKGCLPVFAPGSVWLVGAGPGDPGLLTVAALSALQTAEIVIYDALITDEILSLVPDRTALEFAGKRGGKPSACQPDITKRLIELARAGRRVLRLKGGDPFVFGRGGEEALALAAAHVPYRVVPGITAGIGGLAAAHIPLTTRATNHAVVLMTGHLASGCMDEIDWRPWAATGAPIVLYMAIANLHSIVGGLVAAGMAEETPAAVIANASRADQRVLVTALGRLECDARQSGFSAPAIVVIGSIVEIRGALLRHGLPAAEIV